MAQQIIRRFTCDRCKKPYEENDPESKAAVMVVFQVVTTFVDDKGANIRPLTLEDVCPKCKGRLCDLLSQMRLDRPDPGEKTAAKDEAPIVEVAAPAATDDAAPLTPAPTSEKIAAHKKARAGSAEQTPTT